MKRFAILAAILVLGLMLLSGCGASDSALNPVTPGLTLDDGIPLPTPENTYQVAITRSGTSPLALGWNSFIFPAIGARPFSTISMTCSGQTKLLKDAATARWTLSYVMFFQRNWVQLLCATDGNTFQPGTRYYLWAYKSGSVLNFTQPYINQLSPSLGFAGTEITAQGVNFGAIQGGSNVFYAGAPVIPDSWSETAISFTLPPGAGSGAVQVSVNAETSNPANFTLTWQSMFGGNGDDWCEATQRTADGGCVAVGESHSTDIPGCVNSGACDFFIVKYSSLGVIEWYKMYGGNGFDLPYCVQQSADGGYILAGLSDSTDIPGCPNHGSYDCYVMKLSAAGELQWQQVLGGSDFEWCGSVLQTPDGGFLVGGQSASTDIPGCVNRGSQDYYYVKLAANGTVLWQKMYGGNGEDCITCIIKTLDNSFILMGTSNSTDIPGCVNHGNVDYFLVKLSATGTIVLQKMYGGSGWDWGNSVLQTSDRSYILAGYSDSNDIPGCINHGSEDGYVVKISSSGALLWQSMFGGNNWDESLYALTNPDGGYTIGGYSTSSDIPGCPNHGMTDMYLVKLASNGKVLWQKMHGGSSDENLWNYCLANAPDGGYYTGAMSYSTDIPGCVNHGQGDFYVIKVDGAGNLINEPLISQVDPSAGMPGERITITGAGFGTEPGSVIIHEVAAEPAGITWTDTEIICTVPGAQDGWGQLYLTRPDGWSSNRVPFDIPQ